MLPPKLIQQVYAAHSLKSLLQKIYGCYHEKGDRYEPSILSMAMDQFTLA